jgi:hypothetical protein
VATNSAASIGSIEVQSITVNVEYHVRGMETDGGIGMGSTIIKHFVEGEICIFCCFRLLMCDGAA